MVSIAPENHVAFLSSLSGEFLELRKHLRFKVGTDLWVAEINRPELGEKHPLEIVDALVEVLKKSQVVVCVLAGARRGTAAGGTPIEVEHVVSLVSYFEIEIFQAALSQIPVVFLARSDFDPAPQLSEFLDVLKRSAAITRWKERLSDAQIAEEIKGAIREVRHLRKAARKQLRNAARNLAAALIKARAHLGDVRAGGSDVLWLRGQMIGDANPLGADLDKAQELLNFARAEPRNDRRLSGLYLVFRELMKVPYQNVRDPGSLRLWDDAFDSWWGSAAWFGLHNHLSMGVIGALWSQHQVRAALKTCGGQSDEQSGQAAPFGPLASAYLSLSRMLRPSVLQWRVACAGITMANRVIANEANFDPRIYLARGSLFFVQMRVLKGMEDFETLLSIAQKRSSDMPLNAEAHTYLGRGYLLTRRPRKARDHVKEAVSMWRAQVAETGAGHEFLVKTLKHLAELHLRTRQHDEALQTVAEALKIAEERGISDQARQLSELLPKSKR